MCRVPPGMMVLRTVERPINSSSFYLLRGKSLLMTLKGTIFVSHTLQLQWKPTQVTGGKQNSAGRVLYPDIPVLCDALDGCEQKGGCAVILPGNAAAVWSPLEPLTKRLNFI